jgi:hypothetical protein
MSYTQIDPAITTKSNGDYDIRHKTKIMMSGIESLFQFFFN